MNSDLYVTSDAKKQLTDILASFTDYSSKHLPDDVVKRLKELSEAEHSEFARIIYDAMFENMDMADRLDRPRIGGQVDQERRLLDIRALGIPRIDLAAGHGKLVPRRIGLEDAAVLLAKHFGADGLGHHAIDFLLGRPDILQEDRPAVASRAERLGEQREWINSINVFPVADSDTGTNSLLTLEGGIEALRGLEPHARVDEVLGAFARGALVADLEGADINQSEIIRHTMR